MLILFSSILSVQLALAARLFERPFYDDPEVSQISESASDYQDYSLYNNSWWLIMETMTTVGFGDYFPRTHLGRLVIILACFCGVFIISMTVVTLTSSSEFKQGEKSSYEILHRLRQRKGFEKYAKSVIYYNIRYFHLKKKLQVDKMNADLWADFRNMKEQKKRFETIFHNKRSNMMQTAMVDQINVNFKKIQQRLGSAIKLENRTKEILKSQENTKDKLQETLENYEKVQMEVNRLNLFYIHGNTLKRTDNSSDTVDKQSYFGISTSSPISPSVRISVIKKPQKASSKNVKRDVTPEIIDEDCSKEEIQKRIKELQQLYAKKKLEENIYNDKSILQDSTPSKTRKVTDETESTTRSKKFTLPQIKTNEIKARPIPKYGTDRGNRETLPSHKSLKNIPILMESPKNEEEKQTTKEIRMDYLSPKYIREFVKDADLKKHNNKSDANLNATKIRVFEEIKDDYSPGMTRSKSNANSRRHVVKNLENNYFEDKDCLNLFSKSPHVRNNNFLVHKSKFQLSKTKNVSYPTIEEQDSKEESHGQSSDIIASNKAKSRISPKADQRRTKSQDKKFNSRFKSKILTLFD